MLNNRWNIWRLLSHVRGRLAYCQLARYCDHREVILEWELPVVDQVPFPLLVSGLLPNWLPYGTPSRLSISRV